MSDQAKIDFLQERIRILEKLVGMLVYKAGAHPPQIEQWQASVLAGPDGIPAVAVAALPLTEWARLRS